MFLWVCLYNHQSMHLDKWLKHQSKLTQLSTYTELNILNTSKLPPAGLWRNVSFILFTKATSFTNIFMGCHAMATTVGHWLWNDSCCGETLPSPQWGKNSLRWVVSSLPLSFLWICSTVTSTQCCGHCNYDFVSPFIVHFQSLQLLLAFHLPLCHFLHFLSLHTYRFLCFLQLCFSLQQLLISRQVQYLERFTRLKSKILR